MEKSTVLKIKKLYGKTLVGHGVRTESETTYLVTGIRDLGLEVSDLSDYLNIVPDRLFMDNRVTISEVIPRERLLKNYSRRCQKIEKRLGINGRKVKKLTRDE